MKAIIESSCINIIISILTSDADAIVLLLASLLVAGLPAIAGLPAVVGLPAIAGLPSAVDVC